MGMSTSINDLQSRYATFVRERDWERYHTPQNLAKALSVESNELLECFLWHDNLSADVIKQDEELTDQIEEELADVTIYVMGMAETLDLDLATIVEEKLDENERRFDQETVAELEEDFQRWQRD